jgi:hypothetical protein
LGKPNIAVHQELPPGFNQYTQDYAQFCAVPPESSAFYEVSNGRIIQSKLDNATWNPPEWGHPPDLPIPGGSWDGVPMDSPIPNLAGEGPWIDELCLRIHGEPRYRARGRYYGCRKKRSSPAKSLGDPGRERSSDCAADLRSHIHHRRDDTCILAGNIGRDGPI